MLYITHKQTLTYSFSSQKSINKNKKMFFTNIFFLTFFHSKKKPHSFLYDILCRIFFTDFLFFFCCFFTFFYTFKICVIHHQDTFPHFSTKLPLLFLPKKNLHPFPISHQNSTTTKKCVIHTRTKTITQFFYLF